MKVVLAALGFVNGDTYRNEKVIIDSIKLYSGKADLILYGEAFLQGFYCATFDENKDSLLAISKDDEIIKNICESARSYQIAVSFGFFEKEGKLFFSSQLTIDQNGNIIDLYRRISPGWKESFASSSYMEGDSFHLFSFKGYRIAIGLCGDLWYEENVKSMNLLSPDIVMWPVYTDFNFNEWNTKIKFEYLEQATKLCNKVLYVNSYCLDKNEDEIARGGAAYFKNNEIDAEIPSGKEGFLLVNI